MAHCQICHTEFPEMIGKSITAAEFHRMIYNGFNPFTTRMIRFGPGFTLTDLGFADAQATGILYANWRLIALASRTNWLLCDTCYQAASLYLRKWWHVRKPKALRGKKEVRVLRTGSSQMSRRMPGREAAQCPALNVTM